MVIDFSLYVPDLTLNSGTFGVSDAVLMPSTFGRLITPAPMSGPALTAPFLSSLISLLLLVPDRSFKISLFADKITAASPNTIGHDTDVPLMRIKPPPIPVDAILTPGAAKSTHGPKVENDVL